MRQTQGTYDYLRPRPLRDEWNVSLQGDLLTVQCVRADPPLRPPPRRGVIGGFTRSARLRMFKLMATMNWSRCMPALFVTLTYPDALQVRTYADRSKDRYLWHRALEKHVGKSACMLWRTEWEPRKSGPFLGVPVPHHHLCLWGVRFIAWQLVRRWWQEAIGWGDYVRTDVRAIGDAAAAARYTAKYAAKEQSVSLVIAPYRNKTIGRAWGVTRKPLLPVYPAQVENGLDDERASFLRRFASRIVPFYDEFAGGSFSLFGKQGKNLGNAVLAKKTGQPGEDTLH